jgi:hypothetical protein
MEPTLENPLSKNARMGSLTPTMTAASGAFSDSTRTIIVGEEVSDVLYRKD